MKKDKIYAERASMRKDNSELMLKVLRILDKTFYGLHHVYGKLEEDDCSINLNIHAGCALATFDFNQLTNLVIGAHEECVRLQINSSGPRMVKLYFHPREREGAMSRRHPTIESAINCYRTGEYLTVQTNHQSTNPACGDVPNPKPTAAPSKEGQ